MFYKTDIFVSGALQTKQNRISKSKVKKLRTKPNESSRTSLQNVNKLCRAFIGI